MNLIPTILGGIFGAGGLAALLQARSLSRKTNAEAQVTLGGGWQTLYEATRHEIDAIRKDARAEINELRERLALVEREERECRARLLRLETGPRQVEGHVVRLIEEEIERREDAAS